MICHKTLKSFCKEDISLIENYDKAIADETQTWHCHHRLETDKQLSRQDLKDANMYYNRPASELILLTRAEHAKLHKEYGKPFDRHSWCKGLRLPEEMRLKMSIAKKGVKRTTPIWNKGIHTHYSEESKARQIEKTKITKSKWTEEYRKEVSNKISKANKGNQVGKNRIWINNGIKTRMVHRTELQDYLDKGYKLGRK